MSRVVANCAGVPGRDTSEPCQVGGGAGAVWRVAVTVTGWRAQAIAENDRGSLVIRPFGQPVAGAASGLQSASQWP